MTIQAEPVRNVNTLNMRCHLQLLLTFQLTSKKAAGATFFPLRDPSPPKPKYKGSHKGDSKFPYLSHFLSVLVLVPPRVPCPTKSPQLYPPNPHCISCTPPLQPQHTRQHARQRSLPVHPLLLCLLRLRVSRPNRRDPGHREALDAFRTRKSRLILCPFLNRLTSHE